MIAALLCLVSTATAQELLPADSVHVQPIGDFWAALAGGGGGAITAGSAAFWILKKIVASLVDEKCARLQAAVEAARTRLQALEESTNTSQSSSDIATLRAEHGVLLARLREDLDDARRENRREARGLREEIAQRLDRLADRIGTAPGR